MVERGSVALHSASNAESRKTIEFAARAVHVTQKTSIECDKKAHTIDESEHECDICLNMAILFLNRNIIKTVPAFMDDWHILMGGDMSILYSLDCPCLRTWNPKRYVFLNFYQRLKP